jgi:hypothetical protein
MKIVDIPYNLQNFAAVDQISPLWTQQGVKDVSCSIHSVGLSCLTLLGNQLGYLAISEFPVPKQGEDAHVSDDIRSDIVWLDRQSYNPILIAEFERYSGVHDQEKLESKVRNLLLAYHRWGRNCNWLILAYWTNGLVQLPKHRKFHEIIEYGFSTPTRLKVEGTQTGKLICLQFVHQEDKQELLRLTDIFPRGSHAI